VKKIYSERVRKKIKVQTVRVKHTLALSNRAASVARSLRVLDDVFRQLFSDENFVTLLRAESMTAIPQSLHRLIEKGSHGHEID
jgi:hypothetical protein